MWNWFFWYYAKFVFCTVIFVTLLSLTNLSTGLREYAIARLLESFQWATTQTRPLIDDEDNADEEDLGKDALSTNGSESDVSAAVSSGRKKRERKVSQDDDRLLIDHQATQSIEKKLSLSRQSSLTRQNSADTPAPPKSTGNTVKVMVSDMLEFVTAGVESIIEDDVTSRFSAAQLSSWNLLTRNRSSYCELTWRAEAFYWTGVFVRYFILFPIRFSCFVFSCFLITILCATIGHLPSEYRRPLYRKSMLMAFRIFARSFSSIIRYHDVHNKPTGGGICVANHTSPIDVTMLSCDNVFAMVGQRQGGILGVFQRSLSRAEHHIWFERNVAKDRKVVLQALQDHVNDPSKLPILIFPEGTCINNTSVMQFKKGSFEVASTIYPIAIKYDNRLGDAFWNSSQEGYLLYLINMMTSWAIMCDIWYLPPMTRLPDESAINFARRVKRVIAQKGGLIDLEWDGNLKRAAVSERLKQEQKEAFFQYLSRTTSISTPPDIKQLQNMIHEIPELRDKSMELLGKDVIKQNENGNADRTDSKTDVAKAEPIDKLENNGHGKTE